MADEITAQGTVHGKVQGVWFRGFARSCAASHGVSGYARNEADGTVAFALTGPPENVKLVLNALREGPRAARVERVEFDWVEVQPMDGFVIL